MSRYVDIEAFEEELCKETADYSELEQRSGSDYSWLWRKKFYEVLKNFPSADVEEVKHGKWIDKPGPYYRMQSWCSCCGQHSGIGGIESNRHKPYCPNCGAKMDLGE